MAAFTSIDVVREREITTIRLNRPERRNALNPSLISELTEALQSSAEDESRVVLLTGAGSAFCAGLDLEHLQTMHQRTAAEHRAESAQIARLLRTLYDLPKPTIAAANGPAIAGGMGLATLCDFTLAVPEAKFGYTEVRIGFVPAIVSAYLLRQVGEKRARDLLLTARLLTAEEALALGLVTRVVSADRLIAEAMDLAEALKANSPQALASVKRLLSGFAREELDRHIAAAVEGNAQARETADFREGVASFLEKRKPEWQRRSGL